MGFRGYGETMNPSIENIQNPKDKKCLQRFIHKKKERKLTIILPAVPSN